MTTKPYDPTLKALVETDPESWPQLLGQPTGPTVVIDADIATVSGAADKVLHVSGDQPYLLHLEFVAGHDATMLARKLHVRNALLEDRHDLPVRSAALLLRREADSPKLTGGYERGFLNEEAYLTFRYQVVRVWQLPPGPLLTGGLAVLPLAPISAVTKDELPGIIKEIGRRLKSRRAHKHAPVILAAAYLLLGLRYPPELAEELFRGVVSMEESSTYQAIVAQAAVAEARKVLRLQGDDAFGQPDAQTVALLDGLNDLARLEKLLKRVRTATNWQELLGQA